MCGISSQTQRLLHQRENPNGFGLQTGPSKRDRVTSSSLPDTVIFTSRYDWYGDGTRNMGTVYMPCMGDGGRPFPFIYVCE